MPRGKKVRAKSVMILIASKQLQNVVLTLLGRQDVHGGYLDYLVYTRVPNDLPSFSNLTLERDHEDGNDGPRKHQSPYRETRPPVQGFWRE